MIIQLHSHEHQCSLGMVEVDNNTANSETPDALIERWWQDFQATQPDNNSQFVEFLTCTGAYKEPEGEFHLKRANTVAASAVPVHHCYL